MTEFEKAPQVACAATKNGAVAGEAAVAGAAAGEAAGEAATAAAGITANDFDIACMRRAIELARGGAGWTNPNPLVGAVIAKDGCVIGEGFHERCGQAHAERNALADCKARGNDPAGATLYVTLEPCCHTGKQPPCTDAVIEAGIARVLVGSRDPNPLVAGKGNALLREAGIEVVEDVLRSECDELNPVFFHFITTKRPFVVAKWAMTLDGKIATRTGDSQWVSCAESRADVHELRHRFAAIMVGKGTALADNPSLTARRNEPSNQPLRVVVDSQLALPLESKLVKTAHDVGVLVATALPEDAQKAQLLREAGVEVVSVPAFASAPAEPETMRESTAAAEPERGLATAAEPAPVANATTAAATGLESASPVPTSDTTRATFSPKVDLAALMDELGARGIDSVLVEGGGTLHGALFEAGLVNHVVVYLAPKVVGGADAKSPVEGAGVSLMADAFELGSPSVERFGADLKLTYEIGDC